MGNATVIWNVEVAEREMQVIEAMPHINPRYGQTYRDALSERTGIAASALGGVLLRLELTGTVRRQPGGAYTIIENEEV